jgi:hypothetical protein
MTMGLMVGAANKKPIATGVGTPCINNRLATGTLPHSQTGKKSPIKLPNKAPNRGFLGITLTNLLSLTKDNSALEKNTPSSKKGIASTNRLRNIVKPLFS